MSTAAGPSPSFRVCPQRHTASPLRSARPPLCLTQAAADDADALLGLRPFEQRPRGVLFELSRCHALKGPRRTQLRCLCLLIAARQSDAQEGEPEGKSAREGGGGGAGTLQPVLLAMLTRRAHACAADALSAAAALPADAASLATLIAEACPPVATRGAARAFAADALARLGAMALRVGLGDGVRPTLAQSMRQRQMLCVLLSWHGAAVAAEEDGRRGDAAPVLGSLTELVTAVQEDIATLAQDLAQGRPVPLSLVPPAKRSPTARALTAQSLPPLPTLASPLPRRPQA